MTPHQPTLPKWSVMIPSYGKGQYLEQTLRSVLAQAPGPEQMQIAVVENPSDNSDIKQIVERVAGTRAEYHANPTNLGMVGNWNRCIELARGELVHILHDDDWVLPGFYAEIERLSASHPLCALYATRALTYKNEVYNGESPQLPTLQYSSHDTSQFFSSNCLYCPSVVIRSSFYKQNGVFLTALTFTPDWEMWVRAISRERGIVSAHCHAAYRTHKGNLTSILAAEGKNLQDILRLKEIWEKEGLGNLVTKNLDSLVIHLAEDQIIFYSKGKDKRALRANYEIWKRIAPWYRHPIFWARWLRNRFRAAPP